MPDHIPSRLSARFLLTFLFLVFLAFQTAISFSLNAANAQGLTPEPADVVSQFRSAPTFRDYLPSRIDLSEHFPEPGHQGAQESSVGWAVAYAARSYYDIASGKQRTSDNPYSPAFLYNNLTSDSNPDCRKGVSISSALGFAQNVGLTDIVSYPYDQASCARTAIASELENAKAGGILGWEPINFFQLDNVKGRLAKGDPVIVGVRFSNDVFDLQWGEIYDNRRLDDGFGHAVVIVGYDETKQAFRFLNSWGPSWSEGGYGWISYGASEARLSAAFFMKLPPDLTPTPPRETVSQNETSTEQGTLSDEEAIATIPDSLVEVPATTEAVVEPERQTDSKEGWKSFIVETTISKINQLDCTHIEAFQADNGLVDFKGVTGSYKDGVTVRDQLRALKDQLGDVEIAIRPWPMCEAIETFWAELFSVDRPNADVTTGDKRGKLTVLKDKEELRFDVTAPGFDGYLYAVYLQANGEAVHLTDPAKSTRIPAGQKIAFGTGPDQPRYVISPPFGDEMILLLSSEQKLSDGQHSRLQTERDFLSIYRKGILAAREGNPNARVTATAVYLRTRGR